MKLKNRLMLAGMTLPIMASAADKPNIVLVMTDDQGWGEMGYMNHPNLKTPNLDQMAENGLRFNRFYAGAAVCSPTRASVLTGRTPARTGVPDHGYGLRHQEKTLAQALKTAGYKTAHFGKWHLNRVRGAGVPVSAEDPYNPGTFGFDYWLTTSNYFDLDPYLGHEGGIEKLKGDSSDIIVDQAMKFIDSNKDQPFMAVVWYGSPHSPFYALPEDMKATGLKDEKLQKYFGELIAIDRSVGALRKGLKERGLAENTLVWFCSDNGGVVDKGGADACGRLRDQKGSYYEGGIRVPGIIEWPAGIKTPRITEFPSVTMDIFPTILDVVGLSDDHLLDVVDGISIAPLFKAEMGERSMTIPFFGKKSAALIDNNYKLVKPKIGKDAYELYDLKNDPKEANDLYSSKPEIAEKMLKRYKQYEVSVQASILGKDYPKGKLTIADPERIEWVTSPIYQKMFDQLIDNPMYKKMIDRANAPAEPVAKNAKGKKGKKSKK